MFVLKMSMAFLPNIEPVSLLIIIYTITLGPLALIPIYIYILLEYLIWGLNLWSISYLYVWLILFIISYLFRHIKSKLSWAIISATFGLMFGALCSIIYIPIEGISFAISWWINGIVFDILHCIGNFVIMIVLYNPLMKLMKYGLSKINFK